jgi:cytochrome c6
MKDRSPVATPIILGLGMMIAAFASEPRAVAAEVPASAAPSRASAETGARLQRGRELFEAYGCGMCHILNDAGAFGDTGPSFDGYADLSEARIIDWVTNGQGAMPAYGKLLSRQDIETVAAYIKQVQIK